MTAPDSTRRVVFRVLGSDVAVLNLVTAEMEALGAPLAHTSNLTTHASFAAARDVDGVISCRAPVSAAGDEEGTLVVVAVHEWAAHERAVERARTLFCDAIARVRHRIASIDYTIE